ncbi:MAG TPA: hypothetical protein VMJ32_10330 [Pirellulales bacterium]|nr:hypothetical protein [Pirellulales bacterium]
MTGLVLFGDGKFHFTSEDKTFEGRFHSVLLRFNPKDADSILKLEQGKQSTDKGVFEMARQITGGVFRHSYHSGMEALIPPEGAFSAALNSQGYGDLLISVADKETIVYSFTDNKPLYEKK